MSSTTISQPMSSTSNFSDTALNNNNSINFKHCSLSQNIITNYRKNQNSLEQNQPLSKKTINSRSSISKAVPNNFFFNSYNSNKEKSENNKNSKKLTRNSSNNITNSIAKIDTKKVSNKPRSSYDYLMPSSNFDTQLTLILMGAPVVGKSTIVNQFLWEIFVREYRPTVEEFNWIEYGTDVANEPKKFQSNNSKFKNSSSVESTDSNNSNCFSNNNANLKQKKIFLLQIIDSAGSRDFLAMRYLYYKMGDAFMVVYSVKDPLSYAEALLIIRKIQQQNTKNAQILLIANKIDLEETNTNITRPEILSTFPAPQNIDFIKISAKNLNQVKQAFHRVIDNLAQQRNLQQPMLQKRRQSMPSRQTASDLGIDATTLEHLVRQHNSHTRHSNCTIS